MGRAQKLRHLHEVGERHNDAQLCDYVGLRLATQLIQAPAVQPLLHSAGSVCEARSIPMCACMLPLSNISCHIHLQQVPT